MATNPMHQFEVHRIGPSLSINGIDLSFTNSSLFMLISSILIIIFFIQEQEELILFLERSSCSMN